MKAENIKNEDVKMTVTIGIKDIQSFTFDLLNIISNNQFSIEFIPVQSN